MAEFYTTNQKLSELVASEFSIQKDKINSEIINDQKKFHLKEIQEKRILEYLDNLEGEKKLDGIYYLVKDEEFGVAIRLRTTENEITNY